MSFESKQAAMARKGNEQTAKTRKDHTGKIEQMAWDKDGLKAEVEGFDDSIQVNWSALARKYNITNKKGELAKNGGQIAQEYLHKEGLNLHRFKRKNMQAGDPRVRRKKLRGIGGM